jgi:hypothetical protein
MSQVIDEVTRLGAMAVEYRAAYSAGNPQRLKIICQRIDEQYREQFPESGAPDPKSGPPVAITNFGFHDAIHSRMYWLSQAPSWRRSADALQCLARVRMTRCVGDRPRV